MEQSNFIVAIKYNPFSGNFFIDFSNEEKNIISVKIDKAVAQRVADELGLKIMEG